MQGVCEVSATRSRVPHGTYAMCFASVARGGFMAIGRSAESNVCHSLDPSAPIVPRRSSKVGDGKRLAQSPKLGVCTTQFRTRSKSTTFSKRRVIANQSRLCKLQNTAPPHSETRIYLSIWADLRSCRDEIEAQDGRLSFLLSMWESLVDWSRSHCQ